MGKWKKNSEGEYFWKFYPHDEATKPSHKPRAADGYQRGDCEFEWTPKKRKKHAERKPIIYHWVHKVNCTHKGSRREEEPTTPGNGPGKYKWKKAESEDGSHSHYEWVWKPKVKKR